MCNYNYRWQIIKHDLGQLHRRSCAHKTYARVIACMCNWEQMAFQLYRGNCITIWPMCAWKLCSGDVLCAAPTWSMCANQLYRGNCITIWPMCAWKLCSGDVLCAAPTWSMCAKKWVSVSDSSCICKSLLTFCLTRVCFERVFWDAMPIVWKKVY